MLLGVQIWNWCMLLLNFYHYEPFFFVTNNFCFSVYFIYTNFPSVWINTVYLFYLFTFRLCILLYFSCKWHVIGYFLYYVSLCILIRVFSPFLFYLNGLKSNLLLCFSIPFLPPSFLVFFWTIQFFVILLLWPHSTNFTISWTVMWHCNTLIPFDLLIFCNHTVMYFIFTNILTLEALLLLC